MRDHLKTFEIRHSDGTAVVVKAMSEDMARQFAMENKWGPAERNQTWPMRSNWLGIGLDVKEIA